VLPYTHTNAHSLTAEIGRRATLCTANPRETTFPYQHTSVAIQCFNAVCLANTFTVSESHRNHTGNTFLLLLILRPIITHTVDIATYSYCTVPYDTASISQIQQRVEESTKQTIKLMLKYINLTNAHTSTYS